MYSRNNANFYVFEENRAILLFPLRNHHGVHVCIYIITCKHVPQILHPAALPNPPSKHFRSDRSRVVFYFCILFFNFLSFSVQHSSVFAPFSLLQSSQHITASYLYVFQCYMSYKRFPMETSVMLIWNNAF